MLTAVELRAQLPARIEKATELAGQHKCAHFFEAVDVKRAASMAGRKMLASEQRRFDKLWNEGQRLQELEDELRNKASRAATSSIFRARLRLARINLTGAR